ncbi:MAG: sugar transferase [candidate division WWE3 bacterium]|nr:sugar transferase [candidate division WWE3 bacterium]
MANSKLSKPLTIDYILYTAAKRLIDIVAAVVGILLFGLPMLMIALARKLEGAERIIFFQTRVGKNGKLFKLYKFSSMITTTDEEEKEYFRRLEKENPKFLEEYQRNNFKFKNDPRITKVGKTIRRFSVDELPQFFNVLRGEMSLVGPRAYKPDELEHQRKAYPGCEKDVRVLLKIKPGVTGLWQVSGRSELDFLQRVKLDAAYARRQSLWEDFKIIFKTPLAMVGGKGAY